MGLKLNSLWKVAVVVCFCFLFLFVHFIWLLTRDASDHNSSFLIMTYWSRQNHFYRCWRIWKWQQQQWSTREEKNKIKDSPQWINQPDSAIGEVKIPINTHLGNSLFFLHHWNRSAPFFGRFFNLRLWSRHFEEAFLIAIQRLNIHHSIAIEYNILHSITPPIAFGPFHNLFLLIFYVLFIHHQSIFSMWCYEFFFPFQIHQIINHTSDCKYSIWRLFM